MTTYELDEGLRGGGKTYRAFHKLAAAALAKSDGHYLFIGPQRSAELMTQTVEEHRLPKEQMRSWNKTKAQIELASGSTIRFMSEDRIDTLPGLRFDGIVADATEVWSNPKKALEALQVLLNPDGFLIETRFEMLVK